MGRCCRGPGAGRSARADCRDSVETGGSQRRRCGAPGYGRRLGSRLGRLSALRADALGLQLRPPKRVAAAVRAQTARAQAVLALLLLDPLADPALLRCVDVAWVRRVVGHAAFISPGSRSEARIESASALPITSGRYATSF